MDGSKFSILLLMCFTVSYAIDCEDGYAWNGATCEDINECDTKCLPGDGICLNLPGTYVCFCPVGYTYNFTSLKCEDLNECNDGNNGGCMQLCVNNDGSFTCACQDGYTLAVNSVHCEDIDECPPNAINPCPTDVPSFCVNIPGSFLCSCPVGYTWDSDTGDCPDVNECLDGNNAGCMQNCVNNDGSFACGCIEGYTLLSDGVNCEGGQEPCTCYFRGDPAMRPFDGDWRLVPQAGFYTLMDLYYEGCSLELWVTLEGKENPANRMFITTVTLQYDDTINNNPDGTLTIDDNGKVWHQSGTVARHQVTLPFAGSSGYNVAKEGKWIVVDMPVCGYVVKFHGKGMSSVVEFTVPPGPYPPTGMCGDCDGHVEGYVDRMGNDLSGDVNKYRKAADKFRGDVGR